MAIKKAKKEETLVVHKLYGGEVTVTLDGRHKYVVHDKGVLVTDVVNVTGISGILDKPGLKFWATNLACDHILEIIKSGGTVTEEAIEVARRRHTQYTKEAADLGTLVHDWAEAYIRSILEGKKPLALPEDERVLNGVLSFLRWKDQTDVEFVSTERIVYSRKHHYVGKMDAEIRLNKKLIVADWKTSNPRKPKKPTDECRLCGTVGCGGVYNEYRYQTSLYEGAAIEEAGKNIYEADRMIARFDKETGEFATHVIGEFERDFETSIHLLHAKRRELELEQ